MTQITPYDDAIRSNGGLLRFKPFGRFFFPYLSQLVRGGAKIYESLWQDLNPPISFGVETLKYVVFSNQVNRLVTTMHGR